MVGGLGRVVDGAWVAGVMRWGLGGLVLRCIIKIRNVEKTL